MIVLLQYVGTLREQLEELAEEKTSDGIPRSILHFPFTFFNLFSRVKVAFMSSPSWLYNN